jgi:hypothetical protein
MVRIILNASGALEHLEARPSQALSGTSGRLALAATAGDWSGLLIAAGLDAARFKPSQPDAQAFVPVYADSRMAWTGSYAEGRPDAIRVEAAALDGRPVFFSIQGPWQTPEYAIAPMSVRFAVTVGAVLIAVLLAAAGLVAWRNVRLGRGDTKAAWRIAAMLFATGVTSWALASAHVPTTGEVTLLLMGLSAAAFQAGSIGLLYVALEPFARRLWPDALISWMRLVNGRFRDPLVASHVLVGVSTGLAFAALRSVTFWATNVPGSGATVSALSARFLTSTVLIDFWICAFLAIGYILVLVLLRSLVRRTWIADAIYVVLFSALLSSIMSSGDGVSYQAVGPWILWFGGVTWVLRRFGLLAVLAAVYASYLTVSLPLPVASWYAGLSLAVPMLVAAGAAWSLYVILTSRPGRASRSAAEPLV